MFAVEFPLTKVLSMGSHYYNAFISYSHTDCGMIAPHVQKGIENIGKPWYWIRKRRLNVFRDESDLSSNPGLWGSIEAALSASDHFILLASPKAAESKWVKQEVEWWLTNRNVTSLFIAVVKGKISWTENPDVKDFDWKLTDCLPMASKQRFSNEPLYIDLRAYNNVNKKSILEESGFKSQIVKVISGIVGEPPRDIDSDELKRQNNIKRFFERNRLIVSWARGVSYLFFLIGFALVILKPVIG